MTRINLGIYPHELCDKHLVAEYRELPRVLGIAIKRFVNNDMPKNPEFTLGAGHVLYFLDKGEFLKTRWESLKSEMIYRGFSPTLDWREFPEVLSKEVSPQDFIRGRKLLIERINEKLPPKAKWTNRQAPCWINKMEKVSA